MLPSRLIVDSEDRKPALIADGELLDRAEWLATILAHAADVIGIIDLDGRLLYLNRTLPGYSMRDVVGRNAAEFLPGQSRGLWEDALRRAIASGAPQDIEVESAGALSWRTRLVPVRRAGTVAYLTVIGTDVTAERHTETALRAREQQLRLALEASGMGQWWWNVARDEVTWDATAKRIFGLPLERDDITYATFLGRVHPDDVERVKQHVGAAVTTGSYPELECRIAQPDGSERWVLVTGRVLTDAEGKATDLIGGVVDITQSKTGDAQRRRTQKLEAIGQLAGGVAHDFNNLLVAIMGNIELARRVTDPGQRDGYLAEALVASSRAADLTRQLLAFGRRQQLHRDELDVNEVVADTMKLMRRLLPESIVVDIERSDGDVSVHGDRGQLEQVLVNLCVNARDAMPNGGRLVINVSEKELEARHHESHPWARSGRHVVVSVRDTGVGIPPELIDRVFEPFFTTKPQGTGLGLASAYGTIKHHGGVLQVASDPGVGTTFEVFLPLAPAAQTSSKPQALAAVRGGAETILVAEDEPAVSYVVQRILEGAGYRVVTAEDGARALEVFRQEKASISLALLDAVMPHLSGAEVAVEVRALRSDVGIILSTGYSDALAEAPAVSEIDEVLPKPYEPDQLLRAIRGVLDARKRLRGE